MRGLAFVPAIAAAPAFAHHEVIVATSVLPAAGGMALIVMAALAALRQKLRRKRDVSHIPLPSIGAADPSESGP